MPTFKKVFPTNGPAVTLTPDKIFQFSGGLYEFRAINRADLYKAVTSSSFLKLLKNPSAFAPAPYVSLRALDDINDPGLKMYGIGVDIAPNGRLDIGCQSFTGDNAAALLRWARAYSRTKTYKQTQKAAAARKRARARKAKKLSRPRS